ncbi:fungal-specific transcription factor domain-containing protein [Desarmillaria tabescens]|uniref:Fungal-specific transcription factor domain-containing protein n=1 Tax=Armillaria tabescens TaxID=1929756 RepID=A0AA39NNZ0_ARMTA|nr:fungal-specific transcription factor domain-containing protein [Desarmillaria tabescens]KAK0469055.1 fungal-specific transcription factor domain-containing protein [Desarmillaria tabescens]
MPEHDTALQKDGTGQTCSEYKVQVNRNVTFAGGNCFSPHTTTFTAPSGSVSCLRRPSLQQRRRSKRQTFSSLFEYKLPTGKCRAGSCLPGSKLSPTNRHGRMLEPDSTASTSLGDEILVPPPKQKRSSVACRRCRRLRAKCVKDEEKGRCRGCIEAGVPNECQFLPRGMSAIDRAPRPPQNRKRQTRPKDLDGGRHTDGYDGAKAGPLSPQSPVERFCDNCSQSLTSKSSSHQDLLPPHEELVEACEWFFSTYFQLGFLHKPTFMHTLQTSPQSLSTFLLLSMLSVSARFTPTLIQRFSTPVNAANTFAKRAQSLVGQELLAAASLDRAQAFFLCSIWNWGSGFRDRSWIFLGIAARMASVLRLSQEESFDLGPDATVEQIINAEVSRRTWWVIFMSDNLLSSGCGRPISFDLDKVTIPLPCDEDHFTFGYNGPATVMEGTHARPRLAPQSRFPIDPQLSSEIADTSATNVNGGERSLYGNLVIIADIWARVARGTLLRSKAGPTIAPWRSESDYFKLATELQNWENKLSNRQTWSLSNLLAYQSKSLDLGYRCIFLIMHLSHIVLRRSYLPMMARDVHSSTINPSNYRSEVAPPRFWENVVHEMFAHALKVIELVKSWVPTMPFTRGSTPMMGFAIYMSGSVLSYLKRWTWLCPPLAEYSGTAIQDALALLLELSVVWPTMADRWHSSLKEASCAIPARHENPHRQVEGFGSAAEEDLSTDDREGMYRHKYRGTLEEAGVHEEPVPIPDSVPKEETSPIPHPHGADMLYSLATAASHRMQPPPPSGGVPFANGTQNGSVPATWVNYQEDLVTLFNKDDLSSHLEYSGDGWAF